VVVVGTLSPSPMADNKEIIPRQYDLDAKWDACLDLTVRRFVYSSFAGAFGGLLLFSQYLLSFNLLFILFSQSDGCFVILNLFPKVIRACVCTFIHITRLKSLPYFASPFDSNFIP
jgi:hypothetical protein